MENKSNRLLTKQDEYSPQFIKLAHLYRLFKGKQQYILEMLDIFMEQLPDALLKMEQHIEVKNKKGVNYEAHNIKSTIKTMGLKELAKVALSLEYCEADTWEEIEANYKTFKKEALVEAKALNDERNLLEK